MERARAIFFVLAIRRIQQRKHQRIRNSRMILLLLRYLRHVRISNQLIPILCSFLPMGRRYWMVQYDQDWFQNMWNNRYEDIYDELWVREFRLKPETFEYVITLVRENMFKRNTRFRNAICIEKRIALAIWRLSTGNSYRSVSKVFGVGISTACTIGNNFCTEIAALAGDIIRFPRNGRETAD